MAPIALLKTALAQTNYITIFDTALHGDWQSQNWEGYPLPTDFNAAAPSWPGAKAIEVNFTNYWDGFGLADMKPGWDFQWNYLNEVRTVEFDIYFAAGSTSPDNLDFILDDTGLSDEPALSSLIPNWNSLTEAQRYEHWFHVTVDLPALHPTIARFFRFILFNNGNFTPHFYLANVQLGWVNRTNPPVITPNSATLNPTYDQLTLAYHTDEYTIGRVDYGVGNFSNAMVGDVNNWNTDFTFTLTNLAFGTTVQYRITASDHRTDTNAAPNVSYFTTTFAVPLKPTQPPAITSFTATNILGNRATLVWSTERPCTAQLTYHKTGGAVMTRSFPTLAASQSGVLDLIEATTLYAVTVTVTDAFGFTNSQSTTFTSGTNSTPDVVITVNTNQTHKISPYIYGINDYYNLKDAPRNLPFDRTGGNRWTAYNWENNASNAGNDWYFESDDYLGGGETPGEAVRSRVATDRANGVASLITVPLQGYVTADKNGSVNISDPNHLAARFKQVIYKKGSAFAAPPNTNDAYVYDDEFLWALRNQFTNDLYADTNLPVFVSLDNEPDLWPSTHEEIQGSAMTPVDTFITNSKALCRAIKDVASGAKTFGPVNFGFSGMSYWQGTYTDFTADNWFVDKYLTEMKKAELAEDRRLLDVYDFHWYPEAVTANNTRIGSLVQANLSADAIQTIVQNPRSLWDTNFTEKSWIADYFGGPIFILKRMQDKIAADYPGTGLAITEYQFGGENNIAGAVAEADYLGIFGSFNLFAASYWRQWTNMPFIAAGFDMYRDYDGNLGTFGDTSLAASSSCASNVTAYVSADSQNPNRHVIVAINRSWSAQDAAFSGINVSGVAKIYRVQNRQSTPVFVGSVPADLSSWVVTLPALSVSTIEITAAGTTYAAWATNNFTPGEQTNSAISGINADPDHAGVPNVLRYAFNLPARGAVSATLVPVLVNAAGQNTPAVHFNRLANAADIVYHLESSVDLIHWSDSSIFAAGNPTSVTVTDATPLAGSTPRFLRVRVEYSP